MTAVKPKPTNKYSPVIAARRRRIADRLDTERAGDRASAKIVATISFVRAHIDPVKLAEEHALTESCWVEYAYMSPFERTEKFHGVYLKAFRDWWGKCKDVNAAPFRLPVPERFSECAEEDLNSLWAARQCADRVGVPYREFIRLAFEQTTAGGWKRFPRPNQLGAATKNGEIARDYWDRWGNHQSMSIEGWSRMFRAENYSGHQQQLRLHEVLEKGIRGKAINLSYYLAGEQHVFPEHIARRRFGDEVVNEALDIVSARLGDEAMKEAREIAGRATTPSAPGCFGYRKFAVASACEQCPMQKACIQIEGMSTTKLVEDYASEDPRRDRKRELGRARVARHRALKRAGLLKQKPQDVTHPL
ncbi:MAG: hypothetical protein JSR50_06545 [Proteobacteria bacterium]|nr:hypothetical protein [Pseudomonadota bacterium]